MINSDNVTNEIILIRYIYFVQIFDSNYLVPSPKDIFKFGLNEFLFELTYCKFDSDILVI